MTGQQLRNSILQEAIQGRLVPNVLQPEEKTGEELLKDILAERQKKENDEKGKKAKKLTLSTIEEEPWELPEGWCWCKLEDLCSFTAGQSPDGKDINEQEGVEFHQGKIYFGDIYLRQANIFTKKISKIAHKDSVLLCMRAPVGDVNITQREICIGRGLSAIKPYAPISAIFLLYWLKSYKTYFEDRATGSTFKAITGEVVKETLIPLPPLSIQHRIVEKIEELLPLVDEYDKASVELETLNKILPDKLRKSVLQEAIHGTLVPNDIPEGEATGAELLQQILKERQEKENKEKGKKAKKLTLSEIDDDVEDLPNGWCWCKLSDIGECLYGVSESAKTQGTYKLLRITDIQDDTVNWGTVPLSDYKKNDVAKYFLLNNDLVFARTGGTVGKSYLIRDVPSNAIYASYLIRVRFQGNALLPKYIKYFFQSPQYWSQIIENSEGTGQPNCNGTKLANLNIPLPPLTIQHRIAEKIEDVFSAIDKLKV